MPDDDEAPELDLEIKESNCGVVTAAVEMPDVSAAILCLTNCRAICAMKCDCTDSIHVISRISKLLHHGFGDRINLLTIHFRK